MNIKTILLSSSALLIILAAVFSINIEEVSNKFYAEAKAEKSLKEMAEAKGSAEFFHAMRANPITGKVENKDIQAAISQINTLSDNANKTTILNQLEWTERGPDNIGGRTRAMMVDRNDSNKFYMGAVSGGFWTSVDRGNTWIKMKGTDSAMRITVSCMAQATNGDIYYGTGESFTGINGINGQGGGFPGGGIFKSTDGGLTSTVLASTAPPTGSTGSTYSYINRIATDPNNANHLFAAVNRGLRESNDGGNTWSLVTNVPSAAPILDVDISSNGNVVLASSSNQMYLSTDGGNTFIPNINVTSRGLPGSSGINRVEVSIAPSDDNFMYCVMSTGTTNGNETKGIYKSSDRGQNWTAIGLGGSQVFNPLGTQGTYNIALGVHPTIPEMVFVGGQLELYRYTPQALWEPIAFWAASAQNGIYVHADMHGIMFNNGNPNEMYVITDGGFFRTQDCTALNPFFVEKNKNYATAQCYGVAANRLGHIVFGTQDNGTAVINGSLSNSPKTSIDAMGGDGMRGAISNIDPDFVFGTSQNGGLRRSTDGGKTMASFRNIFDKNIDNESTPNGSPDEGSPWIAPVELRENELGAHTKSAFMIGFDNNVWFTQNAVGTGTVIWFPLITLNGAQFSAITLADDGKTAFVGSAGGGVWRITGIDLFNTRYQYDDTTTSLLSNGFSGDSLFVVTQLTGPFGGSQITDLEFNSATDELLITTPRYGVANHVFRSTNALAPVPTVTSIQGNLPAMPVYSAAILNQPNSYIIGTDMGVWGTDNGGATWTELNNIGGDEAKWHPRLATMQIAIEPVLQSDSGGYAGEVIYTGTYGRGTFSSISRASTFWPTTTNNVSSKKQSLRIYPNPVSTTAHIEYNDVQKGGDAVIKVMSLTGHTLRSKVSNLQSGNNKVEVDLSGLSRGVYLITVQSANGLSSAKVVKR